MKCPKCKRDIKEEEKSCPYCRYDLVSRPTIEKESNELYDNYKKWILAGIIVLVVVLVVVMIIGVSTDNSKEYMTENYLKYLKSKNNTANMTKTNTNKMNVANATVKIAVIDFSQMSKADIEAWCKTNNVKCSFTETYSDTVGKGLFLSQSINAGNTIEEGEKITISYSLGKEPTLGQKNALSRAKSYLSHSSFSYKGLIEQLEYEEFSHEEAVYGADNCGADWNEQVAKKAKSYMSHSSFSKNRLISQLEYEGFTKEQAQYGASTVGF